MTYIPEIAAISDMHVRSSEIVAAAQRGPVILGSIDICGVYT